MPPWHDDASKIRPMLASTDSAPLQQTGWVYEPKYDGIRALVDLAPAPKKSGARGATTTPHVVIYSRNGNDKTKQFPGIAAALGSLAAKIGVPVVLDGEIVAIDRDGTPLGFQALQDRMHLTGAVDIAQAEETQPAAIVLFDLLRDGAEDLRRMPLAARRLRLQTRVKLTPAVKRLVRLSEIVADDGRELMARATREGWEGLIAKDGHSTYLTGKRTPSWRKLKILHEQEFVVGGWTEPQGARIHFGALLLGYYASGALEFAGSVGTGFDEKELNRLAALFASRRRATSPFAGKVVAGGKPTWIRPDLVAMVRFTEWTSDNQLRQPVYLGLRDDKKATDVIREPDSHPTRTVETAAEPGHAARVKGPRPWKYGKPRTTHEPAPASLAMTGDTHDVVAQLRDLEDAREDAEVKLPDGQTLRVTNLAKVFWPDLGLTKGDLLRYYAEVAPLILPVINDRPLVMRRFPNGIAKSAFYQQRHPEDVPAGVRRTRLPEDIDPPDDGPRDRLIGGGLKTLLYMTQIAAISQDPWFSRVESPLDQDHAAIDLDPGDGTPFSTVIDVACWVKDELDRLGIPGFPKTSGSSGLHIYVPLPPHTSYETGQLLCQVVATIVSTAHPKAATVERMVKKRKRGTVYIDYLQNILGKTIATAYSARASDYAGVSTPLAWKEVGRGLDPRAFTIVTAPARFRRVGDLWASLRTAKAVDIQAVLKKGLK